MILDLQPLAGVANQNTAISEHDLSVQMEPLAQAHAPLHSPKKLSEMKLSQQLRLVEVYVSIPPHLLYVVTKASMYPIMS